MGGLHERFSVMVNDTATPIHKIIRVIENGLSYQYHATWGMVLELLAVVMEVLFLATSHLQIGNNSKSNVFCQFTFNLDVFNIM